MSSTPRTETGLLINPSARLNSLTRLVADIRFLRAIGQIIFLVIIIYALVQVWNNINTALVAQNLAPNFSFLSNRAGFEIGGARGYTPDDTYWQAYLVGLRNTLAVVSVGLVGATILGIFAGIFLLSTNWLIRNITRFVVELLRNTPLLVQIFIMFFVVILVLPQLREAITIPQAGLLSIPPRLLLYVALALIVWRITRGEETPMRRAMVPASLAFVIVTEFTTLLSASNPDWRIASLTADEISRRFTLYTAASGILFAAALLLLHARYLPLALGVLVGQFVGGAAYVTGVFNLAPLTIETTPAIYLSNRGLVYPEIEATARFAEWMAFVALGLGLAVFLFLYLRRLTETTGQPYPRFKYGFIVLVAFTLLGWVIVSSEPLPQTVPVQQDGTTVFMPLEQARAEGLLSPQDELAYSQTPLNVTLPRRQGLRFGTGETLSPEYVALSLALIIYTAAFIAEIVRAGILAVPSGQLEAARALGLTNEQMLRMVILPQALRVIIPPLANQYLNLAKNSSLAIAIAYADTYQVMNTVINQSGQSVTGIVIVMLTYLVISLVIAAVMNWVNGRFQLVTR